ncbi:AraC family transcriptional regulator [Cohnella lubricantis]|uniref:Helix-turn-helix transcriptional regulator n=1 Tax=Cohnella lubricantis TaxID=2163172 RepID=A0A841TDU8_9BACL|nr:AraC family transcriptional regulator [Cohnella lubricantis]MBB6678215.1 helix-turn-helix transcriptional regulator [Cohnella lubricantis]MBP2120070.1 AraC family transcriptional regulator of arabinose operon [Cohnella lubricantis]
MMAIQEIRHDRLMEWFEEEGARPWHTIILLNYGKCVYWINHAKVILEKGDVLFIPRGMNYYAKSVPSVFHEKYEVRFTPGEDANRLPWLASGKWIHLKPAMFEWSAERLRLMADEWRDRAAFADIRGQAIVTELLALWHRQWSEGPVTQTADYHAQRMKDYILEHYRERVTKESLGEYIGVSPNYAAALFRRATGQTISEYVHATRIKKAIYLLADSLLTVGEISDLLGYRDVSYFHRLFKRSTGKNPSEFMKDR